MPQLRIIVGFQQGVVLPLVGDATLIGRDPGCSVVLHPDSSASRKHAVVRREVTGWVVEDLGSLHGTAVNGVRIRTNALADSDELVIGDNVFVFEDADELTAQIEAEAAVESAVEPGIQNRAEVQSLVGQMPQRLRMLAAAMAPTAIGANAIFLDAVTALAAEGHLLVADLPYWAKPSILAALGHFFRAETHWFVCSPQVETGNLGERLLPRETEDLRAAKRGRLVLLDQVNQLPEAAQAEIQEALRSRASAEAQSRKSATAHFFLLGAQDMPSQGESHRNVSGLLANEFVLMSHLSDLDERGSMDAKLELSSSVAGLFEANYMRHVQKSVRSLPVSDHLVRFVVRTVLATHPDHALAPEAVRTNVVTGAPPSSARAILRAAKARAIVEGHLRVRMDHVVSVAPAVLAHRLVLKNGGNSAYRDAEHLARLALERARHEDASHEGASLTPHS
jgi:MoxR-like ATPase